MEHRNQPGEAQVNNKGLPVLAPVKAWQIGTEGGFLPAPVKLYDAATTPPNIGLVLGPGERADLVVDFSLCAGTNVILYNDAPAPYPVGSWLFDYDINNNKVAAIMKPGFGPNTRTLMKITVRHRQPGRLFHPDRASSGAGAAGGGQRSQGRGRSAERSRRGNDVPGRRTLR